jgi:hypothetical protein
MHFEWNDVQFTQVSCGKEHLAAVTSNGKLITMGNPNDGKLGHKVKDSRDPNTKLTAYRPSLVTKSAELDYVEFQDENIKIKQVSCGFTHTVALTEDGRVFTWGNGATGALGHGDAENHPVPKEVEGLKDHTIVKVDCGSEHTVV